MSLNFLLLYLNVFFGWYSNLHKTRLWVGNQNLCPIEFLEYSAVYRVSWSVMYAWVIFNSDYSNQTGTSISRLQCCRMLCLIMYASQLGFMNAVPQLMYLQISELLSFSSNWSVISCSAIHDMHPTDLDFYLLWHVYCRVLPTVAWCILPSSKMQTWYIYPSELKHTCNNVSAFSNKI